MEKKETENITLVAVYIHGNIPVTLPSKVACDGRVMGNKDKRHSVYQSLQHKPTTVLFDGFY